MRFLLFLTVLCLYAGGAGAIVDPTPDLLGLYFEPGADTYCLEGLAPYSQFDLYAIYTNPTIPEMAGFAFGLEFPANVIVLETEVIGNPNWDPVENIPYLVGIDPPRSLTQINVLVRFSVLYTAGEITAALFYLGGLDNPSVPGDQPGAFLPGGNFHTMQVHGVPGPGGILSAIVNGQCVTGNRRTSWDNLRALYR